MHVMTFHKYTESYGEIQLSYRAGGMKIPVHIVGDDYYVTRDGMDAMEKDMSSPGWYDMCVNDGNQPKWDSEHPIIVEGSRDDTEEFSLNIAI